MDVNSKLCALREAIRLLEKKLDLLTRHESSCCGITLTQCHAIVEIGRAKNISLNTLAKILFLNDSTICRTVDALVTAGIAERVTNPNDRRFINISLSEHGKELYADIEDKMNKYYESISQLIPMDKQNQVIESLGILIEAIDKKKNC